MPAQHRSPTIPMIPNLKKSANILLATALLSASAHATIIISESFVGAGALNGTTAETFASGITSAGGSSTWVARSDASQSFNQDGTVVFAGTDKLGAARLSLGSYINDAKGTANGKFTLTTTFGAITGGNTDSGNTSTWISTGFFNGDIPTDKAFYVDPDEDGPLSPYGLATALTRKSNDSGDYYPGPGTTVTGINSINGTGARSFTTILDFTAAGGYNGTTNFGTVTFFSDLNPTVGSSYTYTSDQSFEYVGITVNHSPNTTISNFTLSQVPEPSALMLGTLGSLLLLRRKR